MLVSTTLVIVVAISVIWLVIVDDLAKCFALIGVSYSLIYVLYKAIL